MYIFSDTHYYLSLEELCARACILQKTIWYMLNFHDHTEINFEIIKKHIDRNNYGNDS